MTDLLRRSGEALYGSRWQTDLSEALEVDARTVRRWVAGDTPVPSGVYVDLMRLLDERASDIDELMPALKRAAAP